MEPVYRPLDPEIKEIRLFKLHAATAFDAKIRGHISYMSLNDPCQYEALSYRWGANDFTEEIEVDGQPFYVTKNLATILPYLRDETNEKTMWIDALCINQSDMAERSQQVPLMKEIYTRCTTDLAWLGPNSPSVDPGPMGNETQDIDFLVRGLNLMRNIAEKDDETLAGLRNSWEEYRYRRGKDSAKLVLRHENQSLLDTVLLHAPIWDRIWVMQELSCAPQVVLLARNESLKWDVVAKFLGDTPYSDAFHLVWSHGELRSAFDYTFERAQLIQHQRSIVQDVEAGKYTSTCLDVLARFKFAQSTDPRDKIYGLLGLVSEEHPIKVDYNKTVAQVFANLCQFLIDSSGTLDIICQNPWQADETQRQEQRRINELPSWVADFTMKRYSDISDRFSAFLFAQRGIFNAGPKNCEVPCRISDDRLAIQVKAVFIGTIGQILQPGYFDGNPERSFWWDIPASALRQCIQMYIDAKSPSSVKDGNFAWHRSLYEPTGELAIEAYWRTLAMDCKCYPIQRLSREDIIADSTSFNEIMSESALDNEEEHLMSHHSLISRHMLVRNFQHWTFVISRNGLYCMIRLGVKDGDILAVLDGGKVPVVLRPVHGQGTDYTFVGVAYVHGYMDGEANEAVENGKLCTRELFLV
ncbi:hypothetical protein M406DRAFT_36164 [Cryphonectria parasitica EP155]|uniref:Heterokaryon incompatibility domain-containing protein n=1 Tax=Cryphonectria parasitica (strain ATCC 38755 / EP155) TaxID=660469 RepID=A0A9P4YAE2_CRYP1|nr:uncharacterized protein M406DRAFT_36164 [Cryphonectria parasitica EP155]KAF3769421.1 hypothetical protein M406DRAFT_36164 [Cryphonectria parasitica EP155]